MRPDYYLGLDLGQQRDFTALAVIERRPAGVRDDGLLLRLLERMPLGTPYPDVVWRVGQVVRAVGHCTAVVDGTGVGRPVVDLLREADFNCDLTPVTITGGERSRRDGGWWNVPKKELIVGLQVLVQTQGLTVARDLREWPRLVGELMDMRSRIGGGGHTAFGAWREGAHDDLVLAVALACWRGKVERIGERGERLL